MFSVWLRTSAHRLPSGMAKRWFSAKAANSWSPPDSSSAWANSSR